MPYTKKKQKLENRKTDSKFYAELKAKRARREERGRRMKKYKITSEEYERLLNKQGGACAICRKLNGAGSVKSRRLAVDHCHVTEKVRGLLCVSCNVALGHFKHSPSLLHLAIDYLAGAQS